MTRDQAIKWLTKLDGEIRKFYPLRKNGHIGSSFPQRNLIEYEWLKVKQIIEEHKLPCLLYPTCYGFCFAILENNDATIFSNKQPKKLLMIQDSQFPFSSAKKGFVGQMTTLLELAPLTHGEDNKSLLIRNGFEPLREVGYYEY